jgi:uncharacterized protein YggE
MKHSILAALTICTFCYGQPIMTMPVKGSGFVTAPADYAVINLSIEAEDNVYEKAAARIGQTYQAFIDSLDALSSSELSIKSFPIHKKSSYVLQPQDNSKKYKLEKRVRITIEDISKIDAIVTIAGRMEILLSSDINWESSNRDSLYNIAVTQACNAAVWEAKAYAKALNIKLKRIIEVSPKSLEIFLCNWFLHAALHARSKLYHKVIERRSPIAYRHGPFF